MKNRLAVLERESSMDLSSIVGAPPSTNGNGFHRDGQAAELQAKMLGHALNTYLQGLSQVGAPASLRARDPFASHPWIFAAAMMTAVVAAQAPLRIYRETERVLDARRRKEKGVGRNWTGPKAGRDRRAYEAHLSKSILRRFTWRARGIEEDLGHPLMSVLLRPNPYQDAMQFQQFIDLWYALRGEVFVIQTAAEARRIGPGEQPEELWPYGPDYFEEILSEGARGALVGWWFRPPCWSPLATRVGAGARMRLELHEVVQFKFPNPANPVRGMSRITAAAMGIETDLMIQQQYRALMKNGAVPKGVMQYVGDGDADADTLADKARETKEEHSGPENSGKILHLPKGWQYQVLALSPKDMQDLELMRWNRETELAGMGVPMSVLGVTSEFRTYATQLGQDKNFWDKTIIPMKRSQEKTIDATLLFPETDETFAAYDFSGVEALRAGLEHKMSIARGLCGQELHMPPDRAFELVDLDVEPYPASDQALVSPILSSAEDVAAGALEVGSPTVPPPPAGEEDDSEGAGAEAPVDPGQEPPSTPADGEIPEGEKVRRAVAQAVVRRLFPVAAPTSAPAGIVKLNRVERARNRWKDFVAVQSRIESAMKSPYRAWVERARKDVLRRFDSATGRKADAIDLSSVLPDPDEWTNWLKGLARPAHMAALDATWALTVDELGALPVFEIDDDRIVDFFDRRERRFAGTTTEGLVKRVRKTLEAAQVSGETIQEMRTRLGQVMDVAAGSSKTLTVARTESAGFMNGVRDEMFGLQGFPKTEWTTAGDENVREDHITFGAAGPKERGFNWLSLVGGGGTLRYPGDMEGPAGQVIACRCTAVPAE